MPARVVGLVLHSSGTPVMDRTWIRALMIRHARDRRWRLVDIVEASGPDAAGDELTGRLGGLEQRALPVILLTHGLPPTAAHALAKSHQMALDFLDDTQDGERATLGKVSPSQESAGKLPPDSPLGRMTPAEWSTQVSVDYEVALEILSQMMAIGSRDLARAEASDAADAADRVAELQTRQERYAAELASLRSSDVEGIARIHELYGGHLRRQRSGPSSTSSTSS